MLVQDADDLAIEQYRCCQRLVREQACSERKKEETTRSTQRKKLLRFVCFLWFFLLSDFKFPSAIALAHGLS